MTERPYGFVSVRVYGRHGYLYESASQVPEQLLNPLHIMRVERGSVGAGEPEYTRPRLELTLFGESKKIDTCGISFEEFSTMLQTAMLERVKALPHD